MTEIANSDNTGGVIIPEDFHDEIRAWVKEAKYNERLWNKAIAEGNAYYVDEDGNKTKA